jgi:hypothetical protein
MAQARQGSKRKGSKAAVLGAARVSLAMAGGASANEEPDSRLQTDLLHRPRRQRPGPGLLEEEPERRAAAKLLTRDEARRIA